MDVFQLLGDFLHLVAILLLLMKILANKNVVGLFYKTQELYLVVFLTRYSDLILEHHQGSLYFKIMRFLFIGIRAITIDHMKYKHPYKLSYDHEADSFNHYYLYLAAVVLGLILHKRWSVYGIFQAVSWWLQAFAILPQLQMIAKFNDVENITARIVLFLGLYRFFYILHLIYNWQYLILISFIAGVIRTLFYADFIYYFIKSNQIIRLPI